MSKNEVIAHNVKFYNPDARAIHCMTLDHERNKLALSRSDNSVEIWDVQYIPHLQKLIAENLESSVEDLKWYKGRLFSCGLQGYIIEYDCVSETILNSTPVTGGPAWCLDAHLKKKLLACGTEDGYINILEIQNESIRHFKFLDKQQGRILCISWDKPGEHLVTGSTDVIRIWNLETGHAIHKMTTGRSENKKETIVWSLAVTSDFTIISGDSRGSLCFWDGYMGTQIESFNSHVADILSVVLSKDETVVYCSGVDPLIARYGKVSATLGDSVGGRRKWAKGGQRKIHEHDVRALAALSDNKLFSGGVDGYLVYSSAPPRILIKYPPLLKGPCINVVPSKRFILLRYINCLELWRLGQPVAGQDDCNSLMLLSENQSQILQLKAKDKEFIISSSISLNGKFIAYSTSEAIRFFKFSIETPSVEKLPEPSDCGPCKLITFYELKKRHFCAVVTQKNEINILEMSENGPDVIHTIRPFESGSFCDTISHLLVSPNASYLLAADCKGNIEIWSIKDWSLYCTLPRNQAPVTAVAFNKDSNNVVIAYTDRKILEFSLKEKKFTPFSKKLIHSLPSNWQFPINSIKYDERRDSAVITTDDSSICVFEENEMDEETPETSKRSKSKNSNNNNNNNNQEPPTHSKQPFHIIKKYKHIVALDWLGKEEMVIVSVCPLKLAENLPPTLAKKFGT